MKIILPSLFFSSVLFFSCNKQNDLVAAAQPVVVNNPASSQASVVNMKLNGQTVSFPVITKSRSLANGDMGFTAENDSLKLELKINSILQTGNSTGLVLIGLYSWKLYRKLSESSYEELVTTDKWLGIYNDKPLTDAIVTGEFYFKATDPAASNTNYITGGNFRLVF
jgi:hypothetical protein